MSNFNPAKLTTQYLAPVTAFRPVEGRKYTLTHSDETGELFLSIGNQFNYSAIDPKLRDEVIAEWVPKKGEYILFGRVHVSEGEFDEKYAKVRYLIFNKELPLALSAMIFGDQYFFTNFPWLLDAPIYIHFESNFPQYNHIKRFGTPRYYLQLAIKQTIS
jgi:hypothetical protein